ncbi:fasciclin domain-containing protein [Litoribacter ruber]|uniref:fasciclin domain-containing protein n=1 Tax=Litoribacter ruber TaxID=702568 RepID=UPI001BDA12E7|nr:fasciclin domain-containing protein [Litoribacter ruber]MBT0812432.1 fasciclin domain-containing protein [Litoribacter ruber]
MRSIALLMCLAILGLMSCHQDIDEVLEERTIIQILQENANFSLLEEALIAADLADDLMSDGPFTLFAPSNDAFNSYLSAHGEDMEMFLARPGVRDLLLYHLLSGELLSAQIPNAAIESLLPNKALTFQSSGTNITINDSASILTPDVEASNGVIHGIDQILIPPVDSVEVNFER